MKPTITTLTLVLVLLSTLSFGQKEKFQINGAARGYIFSNELDLDEELDTVTTRKANYGHTLLDLGVSVFPNKNTEVIGMFRIRNELGGFWGGGVFFNVRQLTLRGVAGNVVRYELGDIDLKMTPYTLFNTQEEGVINEGDVFGIRRDVVHYDMFYNDDNTWRMQGAQANFALEMNKEMSINFKGFLTRQRATDGIATPERLFGGGAIKLLQAEQLSIGLNSVNMFDLTETAADSNQFKSSVHTMDVRYTYDVSDDLQVGFKGETGISKAQYINYDDERAPASQEDWFYDAALFTSSNDGKITATLGYKDVGADFLAPGAQTKRIDYSKFPGLYQQFTNDQIGRAQSYSDFISGNTDNSFKISEQLLAYNAAYNNTNPYGMATPNRKGVYIEVTRQDTTKVKHSFVRAAFLTQSRGTGSLEQKNFLLVEAGTDVYINDFIGWEKDLKLDLGVRFENTSRAGEVYETVDLNSVFIDAGLSFEFSQNLDLLLGAKLWSVSGNAYTNERNIFNAIDDFGIENYDFVENTYAAGLRYRFNDRNILSGQYQLFNIEHANDALVDYGISQFTLLYSLSF